MAKRRDELDNVAAHILDQNEVDWTRISADTRLADPDTLDGLRVLEDLARGFRHTLIGGDTREARRADAPLFRFAGLEVRELLGRGGQGEVYRAYDPMLDQDVALKLRPTDSDALAHQFIAEARRLVRVRHANVVSVFGAAHEGGRVGLWMEYIRGDTLAVRLANGPLLPEEAVALGAELCAALAAVHRHGMLHGDVKAENVLCEPGGRVVLADFGAAREVRDFSTLSVSGTLHYLAPEMLLGGDASPASDIYALGVLLYRALSGQYPRRAENLDALTREHTHEPLRPLRQHAPGVPRALASVVERCLAADPSQRPASATALARALELAMAPARTGLLAAAVGAAVLALAALVTLAVWPRTPPAWHTELTLYRRTASGVESLVSGTPVRRGDGLQLAWRSDAQTWLYVLDDDGSAAAVLFPGAGMQPVNPLPAGDVQNLPRDGARSLAWTISGDNAQEEILVIAAAAPQPQLEALIAAWQHSALPARDRRGALALAPARVPGALDSADLQEALAAAQRQDGVRHWRFALPHAD